MQGTYLDVAIWKFVWMVVLKQLVTYNQKFLSTQIGTSHN